MQPRRSPLIPAWLGSLAFAALPLASQAATVLVDDDFESGTLESWSNTGSTNATIVADSGFEGSGTQAAFFTNNTTTLTLTNVLSLQTLNATSITVSFNGAWNGGSSTNRVWLDFSNNGGTTWMVLGNVQNSSPYNTSPYPFVSVTLTEGIAGDAGQTETTSFRNVNGNQYDGSDFTDNALFRFRSTTNDDFYLDDVVISIEAVPEPSAALLGGLGLLALLRRRR